jgi:inositol transport system ATP-binding protein
MDDGAILLRLSGLSKRFPGVQALADVSFEVRGGEVLGLLGENGAGKSTLLKIISGALAPDSGSIEWQGEMIAIADPQTAQKLGIVTIYQEFNLVPTLSVAENIYIGREPCRFGPLIDWAKMRRDTVGVTRRIGLAVDPQTDVSQLSVAEQQMVEIARALSINSRLIIMDEPTSALSETEVSRLFDIIRSLRRDGVSVMFVTHRLEEAMAICDRFAILRDGRLVGTRDRRDITIPGIIEMMVGRVASELYRRPARRHQAGEIRLRARGITSLHNRRTIHGTPLRGVDLELRSGEILGLAGLVGAGRSELARAIFGVDPIESGTLSIDGREVRVRSPEDAIREGMGLVPEDRKRQALFLQLAVRNNFSIASLGQFLTGGIFVNERQETSALQTYRKSMNVRMTGPEQLVSNLSGGNQQKIVLARWLALNPKILIVDEPTRGIDVAAKAEVHELLDALAGRGIAVLVISSELPEVMSIADRIVTMREGRITGELAPSEATQERLMSLMTLEQTAAQ